MRSERENAETRVEHHRVETGTKRFILSEEGGTTMYLCRYSKDVHRNKYRALPIARLTSSPYTTKTARIRCYTMLSGFPVIRAEERVTTDETAVRSVSPRRRNPDTALSFLSFVLLIWGP